MESRTPWTLGKAAAQGLQVPECTIDSAALLVSPSPPLPLDFSNHNLCPPTAGVVFPEPARLAVPERQAELNHCSAYKAVLLETMID